MSDWGQIPKNYVQEFTGEEASKEKKKKPKPEPESDADITTYKTLYDYTARDEYELSFKRGDVSFLFRFFFFFLGGVPFFCI